MLRTFNVFNKTRIFHFFIRTNHLRTKNFKWTKVKNILYKYGKTHLFWLLITRKQQLTINDNLVIKSLILCLIQLFFE